jgi:hypothetical protein
MSGKKGMKRPSFSHVIRRQIWRSIRIMRRFSQPDILRTVPDATTANVKKYFGQLVRHGYIAKDENFTGGRAGEYQSYRLIAEAGPEHPTRCKHCGGSLADPVCHKEKEKEKERETEKEPAAPSDGSEKSDRSDPAPEVIHDAA